MKRKKGITHDAYIHTAMEKKSGFVSALIDWEERNGRDFPWRRLPRTPYSVLVSEILLKRTTSAAANRLFDEFINKYPRIESLVVAKKSELEKMIKKIGLQSQRSRSIIEMASYINGELGDRIPSEYNALLKIPAVGEYTASAILSFGFGIPSAIVDSNVIRVLSRAFKGDTKLPIGTVRDISKAILPQKHHDLFNYGLLDLGALICTYDKPKHGICPIKQYCEFAEKI